MTRDTKEKLTCGEKMGILGQGWIKIPTFNSQSQAKSKQHNSLEFRQRTQVLMLNSLLWNLSCLINDDYDEINLWIKVGRGTSEPLR